MKSYFKLYKPYGYLSQFVTNEKPRKKKKLLGELYPFPKNTMSIGRLDQDSEGLLFLTTDGKKSAEVNSGTVEKEYYVQVDGLITPQAIEHIQAGVSISIHGKNYNCLPCEAFLLPNKPELPARAKKIRDERHGPTSWISISLREGKFRQVKKITAAVGFPTLRLARVRIGNEVIGNMQPGEVRKVSKFELDN